MGERPIQQKHMKSLRLRTVDGFEIAVVTHGRADQDVAVWMHGITVDKDEYLGLYLDGAEFLEERGIASVRFDFRGHGDSSGTPGDFTVVGQNLDLRAVLDYVATKFGGPNVRIHLIRSSFGAPPAIFAAYRYQAQIASLCLIAPVLSYQRTFIHPETEWAQEIFSIKNLKGLDKKGRICFDKTFCVGHQLVEEMHIIDPSTALSQVRQRTLIFHGDKDSMVPYAATRQACRGLRHVHFVTLKNTDHGYTVVGDDDGDAPATLRNKASIFRSIAGHIR